MTKDVSLLCNGDDVLEPEVRRLKSTSETRRAGEGAMVSQESIMVCSNAPPSFTLCLPALRVIVMFVGS